MCIGSMAVHMYIVDVTSLLYRLCVNDVAMKLVCQDLFFGGVVPSERRCKRKSVDGEDVSRGFFLLQQIGSRVLSMPGSPHLVVDGTLLCVVMR